MTPEEFRDAMRNTIGGDIEIGHMRADALMCQVLRALGYGAGVDIFEAEDKWYA